MDSETISRREMLRNIGLAGAAAWAAPVLTSLPAHASTENHARKHCRRFCRGKGECCQVGCTPCSSQANCPSEVGDGAYCFKQWEGGQKCAPDVFCSGVAQCTGTDQCAIGEVCLTFNGCDSCTGETGICVPKCRVCKLAGASPRRQFVRMGRTAAGK
jgi:hypothetical protein